MGEMDGRGDGTERSVMFGNKTDGDGLGGEGDGGRGTDG